MLGIAVPVLSLPAHAAGAEGPQARGLREKQMIRTERLGITRPAGLAYAGDADNFIVLAAPVAGAEPAATAEVIDRFYQPVGSLALPTGPTNPRAVAYDRHGERLLLFDVASRSLRAIPGGAAGAFASERAVRLEAPRVGPLRPVGMTVDPASGEVFVLDRLLRRILRFSPAAADAGAEALAAVPQARSIALGPLAMLDLSGLAFDPASGHLFTLAPARRVLYELGVDGRQVASYDVSAIQLSDPQSMVFAPSADQTDDPAMLSLFVADPGAPGTRRGHVIEMAWTTPVAAASADAGTIATTAATLVRVTPTSAYSPPSPDPSGITYDSVTGRLVIDDGEVDEMGIYAGKEVFETSLTGQLLRSYSVLSFTNEPVGIAFNGNNRHVFISDDDHDIVFDVNPGPDNLVGTGDDTRTSFKTNTFGAGDPEGLGYDRVGNRLFIADGISDEIYVLLPGANGVFNGVPPTGDDSVTHFDTAVFGLVATDMVEWKSDTGTLLVLSSSGTKSVKELTTTGTLVSQIDVSFAPLNQPAGLAYAPSSGGGGMSIYIVNRAVDNNSNPNENDGTLVEISVGGTLPGNAAPSVNAGPDQVIALPAQAAVDGTVSDDGLPSPPTLTTTWSFVSGPGTVTFGNANAVDTQASFSVAGTYVLQLTAADGQLSANDQVQVAVQVAGGNTAPVVNAGPDQTITLPAQASLDGTVTDDGLPTPPVVTSTWTRVSGPGTVAFMNPNAVDTQAAFSVVGTYVLQLASSDGPLSGSDQIQVTVQAAGSATDFRIASGPDDVEENATGSVSNSSTDLELVFDGSNQTVGLRFTGVAIPRGATIANAYVQFSADEIQGEITTLSIQGRADDNAGAFSSAKFGVSALPRTAASVAWIPPAWNTTNQVGPDQRTPDLAPVIQEILNRGGWVSGNALAIIIAGIGHRTADAYDGGASVAPLLHIEVLGAATNTAPTANAGLDQTIQIPAQAALDGTIGDDGQPSPPSLTTVWSVVSGPGPVSFGNANAVDTPAGFTTSGTYVLRLAASDGELITADEVQVTVLPPPTNTAPVVSAGSDQTITIASQAALDGTVTDDGLPLPSTITITWSVVSGPGTVTFQNANAVDTQAGFSAIGTYVLRLAAGDGLLSGSDQVQITVQAANTAPTANAGPDLEVTLPGQAALNGTVGDDGLPSPPSLTTTWSMVSGPGVATFLNANAVDTQASFPVAGTYVLMLTASDGSLSTSDQAQITVYPAGTIFRRIAVGTDDAEESSTGSVSRTNGDIELVFSGSNQVVGLRFTALAIPQGATINSADIQFQADETQSEATSLLIQGQAAGATATFTNTNRNVSSRPRTAASVTWIPAAWNTIGEAGANQRTPDIKAILQEIVSRSDWVSGSSIVIIITGTGHRTAESYEGLASGAARLQLQYQ